VVWTRKIGPKKDLDMFAQTGESLLVADR
jgi:hypothetical protein